MSGRKDYSYLLDAVRQLAAVAATQARQQQRARQTNARLQQAKLKAEAQASQLRLQRQANTRQRLADSAARSANRITDSIAESTVPADQATQDDDAVSQIPQAAIETPAIETPAAAEKQDAIDQQITARVADLLRWRENLAGSEEAQSFAYDRTRAWADETDRIIELTQNDVRNENTLDQLQSHLLEAETIEGDAGDISDQFYARNEVMSDIIASLKEIGFFVQDPEYADAERPDAAVIIRASRGDQTLTTEIELDRKVRSDWQGVHGEYCTEGFFEYVQAMNDRGVEINPDNPDLKPRLLQKGAKDLPGGNQRTRSQN